MTQEHESYRDALREAGEDADESLLSVHASLAAQLGALRSPERDDDDPVPGYDLLAELHQGGQGIVYRALQRSTQRQVAVKLLLGGFHASPRKLRRFQREIELVATLDHPNIATVHDSGVTPDGRPFFVMELIQGEPLGARLRQRSLGGRSVNEPTTREMLRIVLDVCRAVHYAHQRGVLHRDLKPGNVLVDESGAPHVVDFGLGVPTDEVVAAGSRLTRTGEFMGTLAYASPEHVCGIPEEIDVRSDVYCLGVMLYEVLTGELPYPVEGPILDVVRHIQTTAPKLPTAVRRLRSRSGSVERVLAGVDRDLDTIVQRALAKEKNRRYQTAGELGADLDRYLEGQPILARGESTWYVLKKALLRHRAATAAVVTVLVSLVVATVVSLTAWKRAVHAAEEAQTQAGVAEREALRAEEIVAYLQATMFAVTPDQARGHAVTVREVLDESTAMLDEARFKSPAAEYELRVTIGKTYQELGLSREAERQFRAAAPLAEALFGAGSFELCDLELSRSGAAISLAEYQRARRLAEGVLLALDAAEQPNHGLRGLAHSHLANIHAITGEPERAEEHLQASQAAYSQRYGVDSPQVAGLYDTQARILLMRGQFDAAEELAQEAHARWQATDAGGVGAARALQVLGEISRERGDYPTARERCLRETALVRQLYGDEHPRALVARSALAIIDLHLRGPDAVAEEVEAIYALRPGLETRDLFTARTLHNLGSLLEHLAEYDRAEEVLVEAIARFDQIFEDDTVDRNAALGLRGWVLLRLGRSMEARALIEEALTRIQKLGGERTPSEANFRLQLAWVLFQSGEAEVAIEEARTALAIRRQFYPAEHDQVNSAQADLGLFHYARGDYSAAELHLREARQRHEESGRPPSRGYLSTLHTLGEVLRDRAEYGEARELLERALRLRESLLPDHHPSVAESLNAWSMFRYYAGERDSAIKANWERALAIFQRHGNDARACWVASNLGAWATNVEGDEAAGTEWADLSLELGTRGGATHHPLWGTLLANRGMMHRKANEAQLGLELLERAYAALLENAPGAAVTRGVLQRLITALEQDGYQARAGELRAQLAERGED